MGNDKSLIEIVNPKPNSTVMIYDVHASESGALAILDDFYRQIRTHIDILPLCGGLRTGTGYDGERRGLWTSYGR